MTIVSDLIKFFAEGISKHLIPISLAASVYFWSLAAFQPENDKWYCPDALGMLTLFIVEILYKYVVPIFRDKISLYKIQKWQKTISNPKYILSTIKVLDEAALAKLSEIYFECYPESAYWPVHNSAVQSLLCRGFIIGNNFLGQEPEGYYSEYILQPCIKEYLDNHPNIRDKYLNLEGDV